MCAPGRAPGRRHGATLDPVSGNAVQEKDMNQADVQSFGTRTFGPQRESSTPVPDANTVSRL